MRGSNLSPTRLRAIAGRQKTLLAGALALAVILAAATAWPPAPPVAAADVQISKEKFSRHIEEWSEPEGYFDTDNFISNETSYLHVIGELREKVAPGGVYIGVGPDQNFSYIAHTRPSLAVIVDIRRQNMLQHLLYKALFEMSSSRAEFIATIVGKKTPNVPRNAPLPELLRAVSEAATEPDGVSRRFEAIRTWLADRDGMKLAADDYAKIRYVMDSFAREGLDLRFSTLGRVSGTSYPTFQELMLETDRSGKLASYLATDESYHWMKRFQSENRLIPIVGDFAGPRAFRNVGSFLKANDLKVSVFYTSNVEFYIFGGDPWKAYLGNVRALPAAPDAMFIRAYFGNSGAHPENMAGHRSTSLAHDLAGFLADADKGRITDYWDVVNR